MSKWSFETRGDHSDTMLFYFGVANNYYIFVSCQAQLCDRPEIEKSHFIPYIIGIKRPRDIRAGLKLDRSWHC